VARPIPEPAPVTRRDYSFYVHSLCSIREGRITGSPIPTLSSAFLAILPPGIRMRVLAREGKSALYPLYRGPIPPVYRHLMGALIRPPKDEVYRAA